MNFNQKGQSALEYLMTYGWALVVIVIAVAALVVLINPSTIQGNTCDAKLGNIIISQSNISDTNTQFVLVNQTGTTIDNMRFDITGTSSGAQTYTQAGQITLGNTLDPNETETVSFGQLPPFGTGTYSVTYQLTYDTPQLTDLTASAQCRGSI